MDSPPLKSKRRSSRHRRDDIERLRWSLKEGREWPTALLETIALWTDAQETYKGRRYNYFIGGEAFDWLLLAERLCLAIGGLISQRESEDLLFGGRFPDSFDEARFKDLVGVEKYRGYLNYFYGVTVEEALQLAVEREVQKRHLSNCNRYRDDFSEEAFEKLYRTPRSGLLEAFRSEKGYPAKRSMGLSESKEFTYWMFKYRLRASDQAKIASDTRKGLQQLQEMEASSGSKVRPHLGD